MVYQQLNQCGLAGSAVGKPPLRFLVACVVYVFDVYGPNPYKKDKDALFEFFIFGLGA